MRSLYPIIAIVAAACAATAVFGISYNYFKSEEQSKAAGRLSLYRSTVVAELERFSHLTYVLARDAFVIDTAQGRGTETLNQRLAAFAQQSGLDAIYLMRPDGVTISASNASQNNSFVGQDYSFRPYFQQAMQGQQGRFYGIGATTGLPGYFIADAVTDERAQITGVVAIKLDLSKLEDSWRAAGEQVFLANRDGVVLLSADPTWRYQVLQDLSPDQRKNIEVARQFPGQALAALDWEAQGIGEAIIAGDRRIHLTSSALPHGWTLHYFADSNAAATRSWLLTGLVMILAATGFIASQYRHTQRIGAALRRSEAEEVQLRLANDRLAIEIDERKTAERRLKRTQDELGRASRLAALGQLAASVTHELGQPIAAMRNYLTAAEIGDQDGKTVVPRIAGLVDRMEGITRQLKFFAKTEQEDFSDVDLRSALQASIALLSPNIDNAEVELSVELPRLPIVVRGNQLRLEQVMTNILRNAIDAVEDGDARQIWVRMGQSEKIGWFEVADSGHGLGDTTLADLQEPFITTRESGRGMGLGLAISANIVKEHHGLITARDRDGAGAVFRVELPKPPTDEEPDAQ
ncbi:MAG: ATP-binding protein [Albidovulum sp.]